MDLFVFTISYGSLRAQLANFSYPFRAVLFLDKVKRPEQESRSSSRFPWGGGRREGEERLKNREVSR